MSAPHRRRVAKQPFLIHEDRQLEQRPARHTQPEPAPEVSASTRSPTAEEEQHAEEEDVMQDFEDHLEEVGDEELEDQALDGDEDEDENQTADDEDDYYETEPSGDEGPIDPTVQGDMEKLQNTFPDFKQHYRLIKRIGEGTFSTVYKAEDIQYYQYVNQWDLDAKEGQWAPLPLKATSNSRSNSQAAPRRRKRKFVAIKKIYVTSSPARIHNELDLLHDLRDSDSVCPLITAFREADQVIAILPYFRHKDFRQYYHNMTVQDMRVYFRSLFTALAAVHKKGIIHRDIKPTNFLYDPDKKRGVLVDFGLAEREGVDYKPCLCHEESSTRKARIRSSPAFAAALAGQPANGFPKNDTRPSRRANRAGTRGFRAPEVLFKCTDQTSKIDVWSAGVILLTILCRRFPFFNSADDVEALIEIATIFGTRKMKTAAHLHGCMFDCTIPSISQNGFSFEKIMLWSTCRSDASPKAPLTEDEQMAIHFLSQCMDPNPASRISAEEALQSPFLSRVEYDDEGDGEDDDVLMV